MKDNLFYEKLVNGEKPVAVEFDSPAGTDLEKFFEGLKELKEAGERAFKENFKKGRRHQAAPQS